MVLPQLCPREERESGAPSRGESLGAPSRRACRPLRAVTRHPLQAAVTRYSRWMLTVTRSEDEPLMSRYSLLALNADHQSRRYSLLVSGGKALRSPLPLRPFHGLFFQNKESGRYRYCSKKTPSGRVPLPLLFHKNWWKL